MLHNNYNIHHVSKFRYLGSWITKDLDPVTDLRSRIEEARVEWHLQIWELCSATRVL